MYRIIVFLCMLVISTLAWGYNYTWIPPTTRTDLTPLSIHEIGGYRLYCSNSNKGPFVLTHEVTGGSNTTIKLDISYCVVTAFDTEGRESDYSDVAGKPLPPRNSIFSFPDEL